MDKGGPGWNLVTRVDLGGPWQTWVRHTIGHLPTILVQCTMNIHWDLASQTEQQCWCRYTSAGTMVQIYLQSCCVGEARTELVAAQSVKTGPGRSLALLYIVRCTFPHRVLSTDCSRVFLMRDVKLSGSGSGNVIWFDSDATLDNHGLYPCRLC